jgi:hypothetical protein
MPQCANCLEEVDAAADAHVQVVNPMEFKGETQQVTQYYCSVDCLLAKVNH